MDDCKKQVVATQLNNTLDSLQLQTGRRYAAQEHIQVSAAIKRSPENGFCFASRLPIRNSAADAKCL